MISMILSSGRIKISMIPKWWRNTWDEWEVHFFILLSLFLQIFLIFTASSRKHTKGILLRFIWLFYLLADWAASYCVGLISNNQKDHSTKTKRDHLLAFWSPFLLLHLGGPDTITAFSLEDNELWRRHLLGLIFQSGITAYIFFLTSHGNSLWFPTLLVFVAGIIKYSERTRALYIASFNAFRQSLVPDPGPDYGKLMEEFYSRKRAELPAQIVTIPEIAPARPPRTFQNAQENSTEQEIIEAVQKGFFFFQHFKGIIVDMIYSFDDLRIVQDYLDTKSPEKALRVIGIELNFMYEAFYTKVIIVRNWFGYCCKFVSFTSVLLALALFILEEKHGLDKSDIGVTYALLYGALALDIIAFFRLIVTEQTAILSPESQASMFQQFKKYLLEKFGYKMLMRFLMLKEPKWEIINKKPYEGCWRLSTSVLCRRWFGSISGYNLMKHSVEMSNESSHMICVKDGFYKVARFCGFGDLIDQWRFQDDKPFLKELWIYIFHKLKKRSDDIEEDDAEIIRSMCSMRGEWIMEKELKDDKESRDELKPFVDSNEVAFDQSLILWHIATCLCYYYSDNHDEVDAQRMERKREYSMILSDYVIYLLIVQPTMMSSVAGIGQIRFQTTCEQAKMFFSRKSLYQNTDGTERLEKACTHMMEVLKEVKSEDLKRESSISLLFDACRLAKELNKSKLKEKKWEIIASVWVELLSFAAYQCRPTAHLKVLSEGGELISLVWLLMFHLGLGKFEFRDPKTKLLIG